MSQSCASQTAVVTKLERKEKSEKPPALYDLTTLQRDANRILGFTAQQTLDYLQSLYEKKLCTYPRTDSRYLTSDMADGLPALVSNVAAAMPKVGGITIHVNAAQVINDKKVSDHHAVIPTANFKEAALTGLTAGERAVLELVALRLLCAVAQPHEYTETAVMLECAGHSFSAKDRTVMNPGWRVLMEASLETINRTASGLITDIDLNYKALMKERGLDKEPESLAAEPVQEIAVQEPEPVTAPDNGCVPDPAISVESMNAYGYTDSNMLPLTKERALELMERDVSVYMLHTDNTEAMAFDAEEVRSFDGIFGVEASEWETVKDRFAPPDYEKAFLDNTADSFAIYQLRDNDNTAQLRFMNAEYLEKKGLSIEKENYAAVYAGGLDRRGDTQDRLDALYETFNIRRPEDFRGHSLSVSDIVALKQNGVVSCHYVDSRGFKALPDFLKPENYLKNAEMVMEDDYGMIDGIINNGPSKTVAELEEQSKTGTPISLLELAQAVQRENEEKRREQQPVRRVKSGEKPSILAKLKASSVADTKSVKSAPKRSAEREL